MLSDLPEHGRHGRGFAPGRQRSADVLAMALNIIVRSSKSESERRARECADAQRRAYYGREQRDGSRFKSKAGTKEQIKRVLDEV